MPAAASAAGPAAPAIQVGMASGSQRLHLVLPLASRARAPLRPARSDRFTAHAAAQPSSAQRRTGTPSGCAQGQSAGAQPGDPGTAGFTPNQYLTAYGFTQLHQAGFTGQGVRVA